MDCNFAKICYQFVPSLCSFKAGIVFGTCEASLSIALEPLADAGFTLVLLDETLLSLTCSFYLGWRELLED
jgi:hypothetical protein